MANFLKFIGGLIIALGIIGGIAVLTQIDWQHYRIAKQVASELFANEFARADLARAQAVVYPQIAYAAALGFGGMISGSIFLALGTIIAATERLERRLEANTEQVENLLRQQAEHSQAS